MLATIPESERASSVKVLDCEGMPTERAFGVRWNLESDQFGFKVELKDKLPTRHGMLSIVSSVYDPFGFVSPGGKPEVLERMASLTPSTGIFFPLTAVLNHTRQLHHLSDASHFGAVT